MRYLSFTIPGASPGESQQLAAPSGIPAALSGGLNDSGGKVLQLGLQLLFFTAVVIAIIVIMISGIQIITSQGDSNKIAAGKARLVYGIIGLVIVLLAFFMVNAFSSLLGIKPAGLK